MLQAPRTPALKVKFAHTRPWPRSQRSSPAARNLPTASDERCGSLTTRLRVCLLSSKIQLSPLSGWPRRNDDAGQFGIPCSLVWFPDSSCVGGVRRVWEPNYLQHVAFGLGACAGIVEPSKPLLRAAAHPQILVLELRAPMGTCRDANFYLTHPFRT